MLSACSSFAASLCGVHLRMLDGPYSAVRCRGIRTSSVSSCRQAKFSDLSFYLADNFRTQGTPLGICNGMPRALSAIAKLLRVRHIPFLGLTGTGLDDFDGRMIAAALEDAPPVSPRSRKDWI